MRLSSATAYALQIPLVETFRHSARDRSFCDSVVVRVRDETGAEGFGEGVPRPYVTGETTDSMLAHVGRLWTLGLGRELPKPDDHGLLQAIEAWLPPQPLPGTLADHASRAMTTAAQCAAAGSRLRPRVIPNRQPGAPRRALSARARSRRGPRRP